MVDGRLGSALILDRDLEIAILWRPCRIRVLFGGCARAAWVFGERGGGGGGIIVLGEGR